MNIVQVSTEPRQDFGKKANSSLRNTGKIPAVLYSKNGVKHFSTTLSEVKEVVYTPDLKIAEIKVGDAVYKAILKDISFHPVTDDILHIDFLELIDGRPLKVFIPVRFKGESVGVKSGGRLATSLRSVRVKTVPEHLVDELYGDISDLELGMSLRIKDLELPEGIEVLASPNVPIVSVVAPRALKTLEEEAEEGEEGEEGSTEEAEDAGDSAD